MIICNQFCQMVFSDTKTSKQKMTENLNTTENSSFLILSSSFLIFLHLISYDFIWFHLISWYYHIYNTHIYHIHTITHWSTWFLQAAMIPFQNAVLMESSDWVRRCELLASLSQGRETHAWGTILTKYSVCESYCQFLWTCCVNAA